MARKKSFNDIANQTERLFNTALWKQNNSSRARKISNIGKRYLDNIRNSKWGKSMFAQRDSLIKKGHKNKAIELGKSGANVKHERNLYMGVKAKGAVAG